MPDGATQPAIDAPQEPVLKQIGFWQRFRKNGPAVTALVVMVLLFVIGMGYWALHGLGVNWPADPLEPNPPAQLIAPCWQHPLGTDDLGRDVMSRVLLGAHVSLMIGFVAVGIAIVIGIILGSISGYFGGWVDMVIMRFVDMMMCIPTFFLILTVAALLQPSIWIVALIIGVTSWMGTARLVRAEFLSLREMDYVQAARATGAGHARIIFRHVLPNALPPVFVTAVLGVAGAILTEASLSYLGFGVQPPDPSWGNIISGGKQYILDAWWLIVFPSVAIFITTLSFYVAGEGMRVAMDPKETKQI
ncbi:MAG: ABC transporter permease [Planctomycetaceae bacterium]|nr:ABC transporter permease [Planctomycetaceae bacterium]